MSLAFDRLFNGYYNSGPKSGLNPGGLANDGHEVNFPAALGDTATVVAEAAASAAAAAASAATALNAPSASSTSADTETLTNSGAITFTTQSGKPWAIGMYVRAAATSAGAPQNDWMSGFVTSYSGTSLIVQMDNKGSGTGSKSAWTITHTPTAAGSVPTTREVTTAVTTGATPAAALIGGGDLTANRALTLNLASLAQIRAGVSTVALITPGGLVAANDFVALADAATVAWDMALAPAAWLIIGGNRTMGLPTNFAAGCTYLLVVQQDGTGSRTLAWHAFFDWGRVGAPTISTGANKIDMFWITVHSISPAGVARVTYSLAA